jgi:hypothetical protein
MESGLYVIDAAKRLSTKQVHSMQKRRRVMKKLIMIVALGASVIASPAFAQTATQGWPVHRAHSANAQNDVYVDGRYVGSDPDPAVREMLRFDPPGQN